MRLGHARGDQSKHDFLWDIAMDELPERDRHLLLMREEGFSYQEIAAAIGVAPGSVGTLIARAIKRFTAVYRPLEE